MKYTPEIQTALDRRRRRFMVDRALFWVEDRLGPPVLTIPLSLLALLGAVALGHIGAALWWALRGTQ
jgi:hypothetical protein